MSADVRITTGKYEVLASGTVIIANSEVTTITIYPGHEREFSLEFHVETTESENAEVAQKLGAKGKAIADNRMRISMRAVAGLTGGTQKPMKVAESANEELYLQFSLASSRKAKRHTLTYTIYVYPLGKKKSGSKS